MQHNPGKTIVNKNRQHRSRAINPAAAVTAILTLLLLQSSLHAQNLETYWVSYLYVNTELEGVITKEQQWLSQQRELNEEMRRLQEDQSWYNGWIVEIMLARKNARQVAFADSLRLIREQIAGLEARRSEAFRELPLYRASCDTCAWACHMEMNFLHTFQLSSIWQCLRIRYVS